MAETVNQAATNNGAQNTQGGAQQNAPAQESNKTFTQDELNAIVNDRLKREREKYTDYATLKEKADKLDAMEEASKTELQKANDKAAELQEQLDAMKQAAAAQEMREKVAKETGIPANLLNGTTEEECKTQAEAIKAFANPGYPSVKDGGEPACGQNNTSTAQQFAEWFNQQ